MPPGPFGTQIWPHVAWCLLSGRTGRVGDLALAKWAVLEKFGQKWRKIGGQKWRKIGGFGEIWTKMSAGVFFWIFGISCKFVQVRANGQIFAEMWEKCPFQVHRRSSCKFVQVRASSCECARVGFKDFWAKMLSWGEDGPKHRKICQKWSKTARERTGVPLGTFWRGEQGGRKKKTLTFR